MGRGDPTEIGAIEGKPMASEGLSDKARNNTMPPFAAPPDFDAEPVNAVSEPFERHQLMNWQAPDSVRVRIRIKGQLPGPAA